MGEDRRTRLLGCRDGLAHALNSISSLRRSITGPSGEYLPPKRHTRKRAAAEARIAELDKARDAIRRQLKGVQDALATPTAPLQENTMTDLRAKLLKDAIRREAEFGRPMTPVEFVDGALEQFNGAVKPLEWNKIDEVNEWSRCRYHSDMYLIEHRKHGDHFDLWVGKNATRAARFDTLQAAKAAAQADYSRRIIAALGVK